jgi:hypothetical protein
MSWSSVTAEHVRRAIAECDELGLVDFRREYGFGEALVYDLVYEGRRYDSKAILGVAYIFANGERPRHYSGGADTVVPRLGKLGFTVENRHISEPLPAARQPLVLIAPCYGDHGSRARFADTLAREVAFADPPVRDYLTDEEREMLLKLHPGGTARFWGATSRYDSDIDDLAVGDPILFTGDLRVQAIGKVGCKLRKRALADALWPPEPGKDSWSNVYSVSEFRRVSDLLYRDIQLPLGYSPRYMFYRTQVTTAEQAAALIASLNLAPDEADDPSDEDRRADEALARALATDSAVVDAEASNTDTTQYQREPGTVVVQRQESRFVARYRQTLPDAQAKRLRLAVGFTDLYLIDTADLIEAKRSAGHRYVREALGQLLDYAAHCTQPLNKLTALFPAKPTASDVYLLHAYGIDCLYWEGGDDFPRLEAPAEARDRIRAAWSSMGQP